MAGGRASRTGKSSGKASGSVPSREDALQSLQQAFETLKATQQGRGDEESARTLCQPSLMRHASSEVRLWAAKCLAEVLRIFVPTPPIETERLQPIMELFVEQLAALSDPTANSYAYAFGLLERLVEIRGLMLIFDCDADSLICSVAETCVTVVKSARQAGRIGSTEDAQRRLETLLAQLLTSLLLEADEIPKIALELLVEELVAKGRACGFVRQVLAGLRKRAAVPLNDFVNKSVFLGDGEKSEKSEKSEKLEKLALQQDRLEGLLNATYELYCIDPSFVARVLPNLQVDLQCANSERRRAITALIGQLLAHCPSPSGDVSGRAALASSSQLVDRFRDRLADADDGVRMTALEGAATLMQSAMALAFDEPTESAAAMLSAAESMREKLADRCLDPNDAIRLRAVEISTQTALTSDVGLTFMLPILPHVCKRILDKRPRVREACAQALAHLYAKHALPHWLSGHVQTAQKLSWIPETLCEAYSVFCNARLGYVSQIEELIEQHILGCGAGLPEDQRAMALVGFYSSVHQEAAQQGLSLLLAKKRDAHAALRRFVQARMANAAPLGEAAARASGEEHQPVPFAKLFEDLAKWSPTLDDKYAKPEALGMHLRALDAVRDKALWAHLNHLLDPCLQDSTSKMAGQIQELDRLLRVHRLAEVAPLIRRALVSTWLLPDQVAALLDAWTDAEHAALAAAARATVAGLPRYFAGAFLPFVGELVKFLGDGGQEDIEATLGAVSSLETNVSRHGLPPPELPAELPELLLAALKTVPAAAAASSAGRVGGILRLLPGEARSAASLRLLAWAEEHQLGAGGEEGPASQVVALHLVAALREHTSQGSLDFDWKPWLAEAERILIRSKQHPSTQHQVERGTCCELECAAAELFAAGAGSEAVAGMLQAPASTSLAVVLPDTEPGHADLGHPFDSVGVHLACAALRSLRLGSLDLSTHLLAQLAEKFSELMADGRPTGDAEKLLQVLQSFQKQTTRLKITDRLRLCTTLPSIFAFAPLKKQRDAAQKLLQGWLKAAHQGPQAGLLDYSLACFVHFLSRLGAFKKEATMTASAFPETSKVCAFYCEALLRCDPAHGAELLGAALRACDRMRYFVDREASGTDAVKVAASALRYVAEKRCPELGLQAAALLQGAAHGSMPAQLFAIDPAIEQRLKVAALADRCAEAPETPALQDSEQLPAGSPQRAQAPEDSAHSALPEEVLTTPQRRPSLLKRPGPSPGTPSSGSGKRSLTGGTVSSALALQSLKKAKKQRAA